MHSPRKENAQIFLRVGFKSGFFAEQIAATVGQRNSSKGSSLSGLFQGTMEGNRLAVLLQADRISVSGGGQDGTEKVSKGHGKDLHGSWMVGWMVECWVEDGGWIGIGRRLLASRWGMRNPFIVWVDLNRVYVGVSWCVVVGSWT
jgi:hypothetical protein